MHCGNLKDFLNPLFWYTLINSPTYGTNYLWSNAKGSIPMFKRKRSKMRQKVKQNWVKSVTKVFFMFIKTSSRSARPPSMS